MADASFDAVIIGAGHNGLTLAAYLARAGLSVGVFERRHEDGGGANTEEATVPGFHHNLHAPYMEFIDYMPIYHPGLEEKTHASIAHYSKHDADTWCEMKGKVVAMDRVLARFLYSSPEQDGSGGAS